MICPRCRSTSAYIVIKGGLYDAPRPYTICPECNRRWAEEEQRDNQLRQRWLYICSVCWGIATLPLFVCSPATLWAFIVPVLTVSALAKIVAVVRTWLIARLGRGLSNHVVARKIPIPESMLRAAAITIAAGVCVRLALVAFGSLASPLMVRVVFRAAFYGVTFLLALFVTLWALSWLSSHGLDALDQSIRNVRLHFFHKNRSRLWLRDYWRVEYLLSGSSYFIDNVADHIAIGIRAVALVWTATGVAAVTLWLAPVFCSVELLGGKLGGITGERSCI